MIFEHLLFDRINNNGNMQNQESDNTIILLDDNVETECDKIVAQAISLDIRGDFGFFLNRTIDEINQNLEYKWTGNLFCITVKKNKNIVEILDITDELNSVWSVNLDDWQEALLDWKNFYLQSLGFWEFNSLAASHMMGVLILAYDQMSNGNCTAEMFTEAIKKCSTRYGVSTSIIYRDCRKVSGLYDIKTFYCWASDLLENQLSQKELSRFVLFNIDRQYGDIRPIIKKHFGITL